ncbi:MAG: PAS domain S-box protein [Candidatus Levyibacteriota bacterium]
MRSKLVHKSHAAIKAHLDFLVNSSNDSIIGTDLKRRITSWNPAAEKLYGYTEQEVLGKNVDIIVPSQKKGEIIKLFEILARHRVVSNYETERLTKDKRLVQVSITISPIKDRKGETIGFSTITRDISRHMQMEKRLQLFAKALEAADDGIQIVGLDGKILFSNKSVERIYGFPPKELQGKSVNDMNKDPLFAEKIILPTLRKKGYWSGEIEVKHKNGSTFSIWLTASVIKHYGKPIALVGGIRDITKKKKLEELKAEFLSTAAHELKTPLTTLKLISESHLRKIKKYGMDQMKISEFNLINTELNRLNLLINDILDDSRIETQKLHMLFECTDLNKLILGVIKKMQIIYKHHKITYNNKKIKMQVIADPMRIEQVLINLISNAAKYSPIFSEIQVYVKQEEDGKTEVSVKDSGGGIPEEQRDLIFQRFYQIDRNSTKGFGLGLYITQEIIKGHRGKLWVDANKPKGSIFHFTLQTI